MGRAVLIAGAGVSALLLGACGWFGDSRNKFDDDTTVDQRITSVRVANDAGSVTIRTGDRTSVHRSVHYDREQPGATTRVEGEVLVIDTCSPRNCWIDYEVTVPAGTKVDGSVDSGRVDVDGVSQVNLKVDSGGVTVRRVPGQVNLDVSSGRVNLSDIGDSVVVRSQSGSVDVDGARGEVTVHSDSGRVSVRMAAAQNVLAEADSGRIEVTVPPGAYRVNASSDSGTVDSAVPNDPSASHRLELRADSGSITVRHL